MTKYVQWTNDCKVTEEDEIELLNDMANFGSCYVMNENGIGRRIAPEDMHIRMEDKKNDNS